MNNIFEGYLIGHVFENMEDLKGFIEANSICMQDGSYLADIEVIEGLQKNKSIWIEYNGRENVSRAGYYYDITCWKAGMTDCDEELDVFNETKTYEESYDFKGYYQFCKGIELETEEDIQRKADQIIKHLYK